MGSNTLLCNVFDVDVENWGAFAGTIKDLKGNHCDVNCNDVLGDCLSVSAGLVPPAALNGQE